MCAVQVTNGGNAANLMDEWSAVSAPAVAPPQPEQLQADLQQQMASGVQPRLELQLGPQEMPVRVVALSGCLSMANAGRGQKHRCSTMLETLARALNPAVGVILCIISSLLCSSLRPVPS